MQLKCVAIDSESWAVELIKKYISKIPSLQLVRVFLDTITASEFLQANAVDLIFMDISITAGIEWMCSLEQKPMTIFTTSHKKYALLGFELEAVDYLLKPVDFERFSKAVNRAMDLHRFRQYSKNNPAGYLSVRSGYKTVRIDEDEIEFIEGNVNYIKIHISNSPPVLSLMTLKEILVKLPSDKFKRIHRSYIVPVSKIKFLQNKKVLLFSSTELPIGDSYTGSVDQWKNQ
jgi:two-component system, LytTR family, response regulator